MKEEIKSEVVELKSVKLAKAESYMTNYSNMPVNWSPDDIDKLEIQGLDDYKKVTNDCRFFYRREPIASTVINKMVDIAINDIIFEKNGLSDNEFRVFTGMKPKLLDFMESCALEYLVTGMVVPEIKYENVGKEFLNELEVKKYSTLELPTSMWLRDPSTIEIRSSQVLDEPSYFVKLPDEVVTFIRNEGKYSTGIEDKELYKKIRVLYPEFVRQVQAGNKEVLIENDKLIVRRKVITGSQYPLPFLYPAMESLKHKRNLRRMDYSIAARVIAAILLVKLGNDLYPVVEGDEKVFSFIRDQLAYRGSSNRDIERVFTLFANHTLTMEWITPNVEVLLNADKYSEINQEIFYALGFPHILTVGETTRTQVSDANIATLSPVKTMNKMREELLPILKNIVFNISDRNSFKAVPLTRFEQINLMTVTDFVELTRFLYDTSNISRETLDNAFGYVFDEEVKKRADDEKLVVELGIPEFAPTPFSPQPTNTTKPAPKTEKPAKPAPKAK